MFGSDEPKKKRQPRGLADECIGWWRENFPSEVYDARGERVAYRMHPADGKAVSALVRDETPNGLTLELFQRRARALLRSRKPFWMENRNLRTLCWKWSDIASLEVVESAPPKRSHLGQPQTFVSDPSFRAELERQAREAQARFKQTNPPKVINRKSTDCG